MINGLGTRKQLYDDFVFIFIQKWLDEFEAGPLADVPEVHPKVVRSEIILYDCKQ